MVHAYVNVRDTPTTTGRSLGTKAKGAVLEVDLEPPGMGWVRLAERVRGAEAWVLLDGTKLGLGPLLRKLSSGSVAAAAPTAAPAGAAAAPVAARTAANPVAVLQTGAVEPLLAPVAYVVVHTVVYVRNAPSRAGAQLGTKRKGEVVSASARCDGWIRLAPPQRKRLPLRVQPNEAFDSLLAQRLHC